MTSPKSLYKEVLVKVNSSVYFGTWSGKESQMVNFQKVWDGKGPGPLYAPLTRDIIIFFSETWW